jgi:hypothetical protein
MKRLAALLMFVTSSSCAMEGDPTEPAVTTRAITMPEAIAYSALEPWARLLPPGSDGVVVLHEPSGTSTIYRNVYVVDVANGSIYLNLTTANDTEFRDLWGRLTTEIVASPVAGFESVLAGRFPPPPPPCYPVSCTYADVVFDDAWRHANIMNPTEYP